MYSQLFLYTSCIFEPCNLLTLHHYWWTHWVTYCRTEVEQVLQIRLLHYAAFIFVLSWRVKLCGGFAPYFGQYFYQRFCLAEYWRRYWIVQQKRINSLRKKMCRTAEHYCIGITGLFLAVVSNSCTYDMWSSWSSARKVEAKIGSVKWVWSICLLAVMDVSESVTIDIL